MKKFILPLIVFSCFTFGASAQDHSWEFGIHSGVNINSGRGNALNNGTKATIKGLNLGAHLLYKFSDHFGIKTMPQYDKNGWMFRKLSFTGTTGLEKGNVYRKLDFINLPILAMYNCGGKKIQFTGGAGIFAGYLVKNMLEIKPDTKSGSTLPATSSSSEAYKKFNYGLSASVGVQFKLTQQIKLNLDVMDNLGLANLHKGQGITRTNALAGIMGLSFSCK